MDEQELIQVNLQLPASALDSLSRLTEQLRKLAIAVSGHPSGASEEFAESAFFDPQRFQALRQGAEASPAWTESAQAQSVRSDADGVVQEPETEEAVKMEGEHPPEREMPTSQVETGNDRPEDAESRRETGEEKEEIPVMEPSQEEEPLEAPSVRMEPDSQIPEAEEVWAQAEERDIPLPAAWEDLPEGVETPLGAGHVVTAQVEPPANRWTSVTEELVTSGPAPLTAEAVSLAFQRDGRRYDNGFPLY